MNAKMDKSLIAHALLAGVATVAAFVAWSRPAQSGKDANVIVVGGSLDRLTEVDWSEESHDVTLKRTDGHTTISTINKTAKEKRDIRDFPASDKAEEAVAKFAPLKAARSLGKADESRLKELGLETPKQSLTLHFGEAATKLDVGVPTFGNGSYYVRKPDGEVFLVPAATLTPFKSGAGGLIERAVVPVKREHVGEVNTTVGDKSRELVQINPDDRIHSFFADANNPGEKLDRAGSFVDAVLRLRGILTTDKLPEEAPRLTVVFGTDDKREHTVQVWPATAASDVAIVVSTRFPHGVTVTKSAIDTLLRDGAALVDETAPPPTPRRPGAPNAPPARRP